jgi:hypothetical protein
MDALAVVSRLHGGFGWPEQPRHRRAWPLVVVTGSTSSAAPIPPPSVGIGATDVGWPTSQVGRDVGDFPVERKGKGGDLFTFNQTI